MMEGWKKNILFLGGSPRLPGIRARCIEVAQALGCEFRVGIERASEVPKKFRVVVCVGPQLSSEELKKLSARAKVIWDIHEESPPREGIAHYLASTETTRRAFHGRGPTSVIPRHHCNLTAVPNSTSCRIPSWVGDPTRCPDFREFPYIVYSTTQATIEYLIECYRQVGLAINMRKRSPDSSLPARITSGAKLIDCLGFGIPSVSADEPAYRETAEDCTVFCTLPEVAESVKRLQTDSRLYTKLRKRCLLRASDFHVMKIAQRYADFFRAL